MSLLAAITQQCHKTPNKTALQDAQSQLSYAQLEQRLRHLSSLFKPGQRIAVAMDRGVDAASTILAIVYAGACYIPLDLKNPPARLRHIIEDAQPTAVIGLGNKPDWLPNSVTWQPFQIPAQQQDIYPAEPESLAAILYTSGSTGHPKGVALSHRAMRNFADWAGDTFALSAADKIASLAPFYFDLSVFDLFSSLSRGATVSFIPQALTLSPSRLSQWLAKHAISTCYTVPSLLAFLTLKGDLANTPLPQLRQILFAGEVFPTATLKTLTTLLPQTKFYNLYGPTETNVCCYWPVERSRLTDNRPIPIGIAAADADLKIEADSGELWVKSTNNFSGYWQQGKLHPAEFKDGYYPTGDKVSLNTCGEYTYHGRLDRMLKCAGFRVEPAEIEAAFLAHPHVAQCAVIGLADPTAGQRPAAALVLSRNTPLAEIMQFLRKRLAAYMLPSKIKIIDRLPILNTGKIDYSALTELFK